ncbi:subtilisin-like protein [Westerdykella ornata]|uniref:Subtilisin-like protein n=1 Tax=Westerdykella ornata TaxID=318751 RepID=A0A6A6JLD6_WESOR|nr:subtilisin-like protein [Westerdykella ornata]KAF2277401.1 subtilisin-like protein [Westerdykella ornata]
MENSEFAAYVLRAGSHCADALNAMSEIAAVEEKIEVRTFLQKTRTPWGLQEISSDQGASGNPRSQSFTYTFDSETLGDGVDIYVVDTGVRSTHAIFQVPGPDGQPTKSRVTPGFSFLDTPNPTNDGDGHGTHCAGTAAGTRFGVAQNANIIAVKVLGDDGSGSSADTIEGMSWIINRHNQRKTESNFKGSVMSMSWGLSSVSRTVDRVVRAASDAGIHISVAAGNDGADACQNTPASNGGQNSAVVSVGAMNINNQIASFSNIGKCVDIYAPGEDVLSSWIEINGQPSDEALNFLAGTSMACPHVSGVMAYLLGLEENASLRQDPAALKARLLSLGRENTLRGQTGGSANLLLSNGANGSPNSTLQARDDQFLDKRFNFIVASEKTQLRY